MKQRDSFRLMLIDFSLSLSPHLTPSDVCDRSSHENQMPTHMLVHNGKIECDNVNMGEKTKKNAINEIDAKLRGLYYYTYTRIP